MVASSLSRKDIVVQGDTAITREKAALNSSPRVDRNRVYSNDGPSEIGAGPILG